MFMLDTIQRHNYIALCNLKITILPRENSILPLILELLETTVDLLVHVHLYDKRKDFVNEIDKTIKKEKIKK